ncbi:unnamed protein product [Adineta ricciae]|uniref:Uncharacterized protein n=1 Tax=Adineta ricciae TaxID=249248 RepID=A0A816F848_ADIRI|nr:unnamed protein product [Adineta ricciae]CAF1656223.1 unnamed protein product [Adineta ricciae]
MNRLLVRRCSMSSIEEEDEPSTSDELTTQSVQLSSSAAVKHYSQLRQSPSIIEWDSELSESEQEFDDNDDDLNENGEDRAANRALQNFIQTSSKHLQLDRIDQGYLKIAIQRIHTITEGDRREKRKSAQMNNKLKEK